MLSALADGVAGNVERDLAADEEEDAKHNVSQGPSILEGVDDEDDLQQHVDEDADAAEEVEDDEQPHGLRRPQSCPALERTQRNHSADDEHGDGGAAQEPDGERRPILVQLESHEAVDQETHAQRRRQTVLHRRDEGIDGRSGSADARVQDEGGDGEADVDVKERQDLLSTCPRQVLEVRHGRRDTE